MPEVPLPALLARKKLSTWAYFRRWLRTEKFWQEVVTRTIAAIIAGSVVAAGIFLVGRAGGYFGDPTNVAGFWAAVATYGGVVVASVGFVLALIMNARILTRIEPQEPRPGQITVDEAARQILERRRKRRNRR